MKHAGAELCQAHGKLQHICFGHFRFDMFGFGHLLSFVGFIKYALLGLFGVVFIFKVNFIFEVIDIFEAIDMLKVTFIFEEAFILEVVFIFEDIFIFKVIFVFDAVFILKVGLIFEVIFIGISSPGSKTKGKKSKRDSVIEFIPVCM